MANNNRYPPGTKLVRIEMSGEDLNEKHVDQEERPAEPPHQVAQPKIEGREPNSSRIDEHDVDISKLTNQMNAYAARDISQMSSLGQIFFARDAIMSDLENGTLNTDLKTESITSNLRETNHRFMKDFIERINGLDLKDQIEYYERETAAIENALLLSGITDVFELSSAEAELKTVDRKQIEQMRATRDYFLSSLKKIKAATKKEMEDDSSEIPIPESKAQQIAIMGHLGILQLVIEKCMIGNSINFNQAASIISSFTGIHKETVRKCLIPMFQQDADQKNNPMKSSKTLVFIEEFKRGLDHS